MTSESTSASGQTHDPEGTAFAVESLLTTVAALLDPPGCEWNRSQTHASLVTYLVEETFELVEAIEAGTSADLREELGDVLYQVVLHAALSERQDPEKGASFGLADVVREVDEKVRRRHPHVFGADVADGVDDIVRLWSAAKAREKATRESVFDGIPVGLPALARAQKILSRQDRTPLRQVESVTSHGDDRSSGALSDAESEATWGRALLAEVERATALGLDAERALRIAVREREHDLRLLEVTDRVKTARDTERE